MDYDQCDFDVPETVRDLGGEIEALFGRGIPIARAKGSGITSKARGTLKVNETDLRIYLREDATLYDLAHELCHLKRYASGIPMANAGGRAWVSKIENPLEHFAIYPILEGMDLGMDPRNVGDEWEWFRGEFHDLIQGPSAAGKSKWTRNLACVLWDTLLLKSDECLRDEVTKAVQKVNGEAARKGQEIANFVAMDSVRTQGKKATALRKIKRILFGKVRKVPLLQMEISRPPRKEWFRYRPYGKI